MPGPNEILQQTGPNTEPVISEPVGKAGVVPMNEDQAQQEALHKELAGLGAQHTGPDIRVTTNHEATTSTVTPINMPAPEVPKDPKTTHWWNNMFQTKHTEQQMEMEELKDAA